MKIERFEIPGLAQYSYIVSAQDRAAVIDPIRDIERYLAYAAQHNLVITHVLETHIHADFASGAPALADAAGAQLALSAHDRGEQYQYAMPHRALRDGDIIEIGDVRLETLHTPGHTPEHLSFLLFEGNVAQPAALFSGDFLFYGSLGRPDLLGDAAKSGLAGQLYRSLQRVASLPDDVALYPGHGAGSFCGAGLKNEDASTLGHERATNPFFRLDEEAFVQQILSTVPPMPAYYPRMKALNAQGAPALPSLPGSRALFPAEVAELARSGDIDLLDVRSAEAFAVAHIPGSINIGAGPNLSLWAGWLLDPGRRIVLVGDAGDHECSRRSLVRVGLDRIEGHFPNGVAAWWSSGKKVAHFLQLSPQQVQMRPRGDCILDVRGMDEWKSGHIAGATHVPLGVLPGRADLLPAGHGTVVVCEGGYRSSIAASLLAHRGLSSVGYLVGGMAAWKRQKLPVAKD